MAGTREDAAPDQRDGDLEGEDGGTAAGPTVRTGGSIAVAGLRPGLLAAIEDQERASAEFRPGPHWARLSELWAAFVDETRWGQPKNVPAMSPRYRDLEEARRDYAAFRFCDDPERQPAIDGFCEGRPGGSEDYYVELEGSCYSKPTLKYLRALAWAKRFLDGDIEVVLEIGGGHGALGEIVLKSSADTRYLDLDIAVGMVACTLNLSTVFGAEAVIDYSTVRTLDVIDADAAFRAGGRALVVGSWDLPRLRVQADLAVVFKVFQDLEPAVVEAYVAHLQRLGPRYVLIMNREHGGHTTHEPWQPGVDEPTPLSAILAMFDDYAVVAGLRPPLSDGGQRLVLLRRVRT